MTVDFNTQVLALQSPNIPYLMRQVKLSDLEALRQDCWTHHSITRSREHLKIVDDAAKTGRGLGIVVEADASKHIIAFGQILMLSQCSEISDLIVSDAYRCQGIGTAMIQYLVHAFLGSFLPRIEIGVAASNPRALALYKRLGFQVGYELELNLGNGKETVIYLSLNATQSPQHKT